MSLNNERIRFYFRHRDQIEEWAALRTEAAVAVDAWLADLQPDVEALARELASDVRVHAILDEAYPSFRLVRSGWGFGDNNNPPACIAFEWQRSRTTMGDGYFPYVGMRASQTEPLAKPYREAISRANLRRKGDKNTPFWAALRYVGPEGDFPESADGYRVKLLKALRDVWETYAPSIDGVGARPA